MKRIIQGEGEKCPKCYQTMQRRKRTQSRTDACWYSEWDVCISCKHIQHYERYKNFPTKEIYYFNEKQQEKRATLFN